MVRNCNRIFGCTRSLLAKQRLCVAINSVAVRNVRYWSRDGAAFASRARAWQWFLQSQGSLQLGPTGAIDDNWFLRKPVLRKMTTRTVSSLVRRNSLMSQFHAVKKQYQEYILLFQVGDFYELYDKDAELVTEKTTLRATRKQGVMMAGFPVRSLDEWLKVLVEAGFQLAICNQAPKEESAGSYGQLLHREVVQLVTPGTLLEPLTQQANFLLSVAVGPGGSLGLAWLDLSTSQFKVGMTQAEKLDEDLERIAPSEVLVSKATHSLLQSGPLPAHPDQEVHRRLHRSLLSECHLTPVPDSWFSLEGEGLGDSVVEPSSELSTSERTAAAAVLHFVRHTQRSLLPHISPPSRFSHSMHMAIDASSRRNLELFHPALGNARSATLFGCLNRTVTAGGGRLLQDRLSAPLTDLQEINQRLDCVELFSHNTLLAEEVQSKLKSCADLERLVQKVAMNTASVYDLTVIRNTLLAASEGKALMEQGITWGKSLTQELEGLAEFPDLVRELGDAIGRSLATTSGYIRKGYSDEMDSLRAARRSNEGKVGQVIQRLQDASGVSKMSVVPHKSYYRVIEVSKAQTKKAEQCSELVRMDATSAKTRFTCVELQQLNAQHQQLQQMCEVAEQEIFKELCQKVMAHADALLKCAGAVSRLDVALSLGLLAQERGYCRPQLSDDTQMNIIKGRHPVVDALQQAHFVCNDCNMNQHKLWIITGPNMGGKSTFLRQNALIIILAQMGSFVPADSALLGITDSLFARVGASDNVVKHMSTFHLEMTEVAHILANATSKSFVILDEIGRGTSTAEGMSVANAVVEYLQHELGCRSLLATHFHTLAEFANKFDNVGAYKLVARRSSSGLVFTYQIQPGKTDYSFGVDVAELAGLPPSVVGRARTLLEEGRVETTELSQCTTIEEAPQNSAVAAKLTTYIQSLPVDNVSPREAMDILYHLHDIVREAQ